MAPRKTPLRLNDAHYAHLKNVVRGGGVGDGSPSSVALVPVNKKNCYGKSRDHQSSSVIFKANTTILYCGVWHVLNCHVVLC